ncbi:MAG: GPR endopeptidase [Clostridia bacterium]|nr:GPR endopeptidase [Clostridia bacterium]
MLFRTDLAIERAEISNSGKQIKSFKETHGEITINRIKIATEGEAQKLQKPIGNYITIEFPNLINNGGDCSLTENLLAKELTKLLPENKNCILVVGLGNPKITSDSLGPITANRILATRHISKELARQIKLSGLKNVAVLCPGVLGQTGIEVSEILLGISKTVNLDCIIVVDALCAAETKRLGCTVQLSDTGISPGSGIGNHRKEISAISMGVPVIAIGIPTVIYAATIATDLTEYTPDFNNKLTELIVAPKDIDIITERAATIISNAVNIALQPKIEPEILKALV